MVWNQRESIQFVTSVDFFQHEIFVLILSITYKQQLKEK